MEHNPGKYITFIQKPCTFQNSLLPSITLQRWGFVPVWKYKQIRPWGGVCTSLFTKAFPPYKRYPPPTQLDSWDFHIQGGLSRKTASGNSSIFHLWLKTTRGNADLYYLQVPSMAKGRKEICPLLTNFKIPSVPPLL